MVRQQHEKSMPLSNNTALKSSTSNTFITTVTSNDVLASVCDVLLRLLWNVVLPVKFCKLIFNTKYSLIQKT